VSTATLRSMTQKLTSRRHETVGPQTFRTGDLVEIQVSFVVVPMKGERRKMITVLRSIALIDGDFRQVSDTNARTGKK
jgi:hypothetical protein